MKNKVKKKNIHENSQQWKSNIKSIKPISNGYEILFIILLSNIANSITISQLILSIPIFLSPHFSNVLIKQINNYV